jgi:hypothetical protein
VMWLPSPFDVIVSAFLNIFFFGSLIRAALSRTLNTQLRAIVALAIPVVFNLSICILKSGFTLSERIIGGATTLIVCAVLFQAWRDRESKVQA